MRAGVTPLVEVEDLHVHFGAARAVDGASVRVLPGEVLALVGESGSGKTTLIRAIQGLQKPTSGVIRVDGPPAVGGQVLEVVSDDPTARSGLASWSRLTGNPIVAMIDDGPGRTRYYIRRK